MWSSSVKNLFLPDPKIVYNFYIVFTDRIDITGSDLFLQAVSRR